MVRAEPGEPGLQTREGVGCRPSYKRGVVRGTSSVCGVGGGVGGLRTMQRRAPWTSFNIGRTARGTPLSALNRGATLGLKRVKRAAPSAEQQRQPTTAGEPAAVIQHHQNFPLFSCFLSRRLFPLSARQRSAGTGRLTVTLGHNGFLVCSFVSLLFAVGIS